MFSGIYIQTVGEVSFLEASRDVKGFNVSRFELCKVCGYLWKGSVRWPPAQTACLPEQQHVHVQALAGAECCCSNSTLDTDSAEPLKAAAAAAVLGSVFSKNQISEQKDAHFFSPSSLVSGLILHFSYLHIHKHIKTTDMNLDEIWQATFR